jgi:hypothetical protein
MRYRALLERVSAGEFPRGNGACGYELVLPLTTDCRLDLQTWKRRWAGYPARRFGQGADERHGELWHDEDGWFLAFGHGEQSEVAAIVDDEGSFAAGASIAINECDGQTRQFRIVKLRRRSPASQRVLQLQDYCLDLASNGGVGGSGKLDLRLDDQFVQNIRAIILGLPWIWKSHFRRSPRMDRDTGGSASVVLLPDDRIHPLAFDPAAAFGAALPMAGHPHRLAAPGDVAPDARLVEITASGGRQRRNVQMLRLCRRWRHGWGRRGPCRIQGQAACQQHDRSKDELLHELSLR